MTGPFRLLAALRVDAPVLLVGGGTVGTRKARTLRDAGAPVDLVSPEATEELAALATAGRLRWTRREAEPEDFRTHRYAVLALDEATTRRILPLTEGSGCLLCCCALPEAGHFALAAQGRHGDFVLGAASGGSDPGGAAALKRRLLHLLQPQDDKDLRAPAREERHHEKERTP